MLLQPLPHFTNSTDFTIQRLYRILIFYSSSKHNIKTSWRWCRGTETCRSVDIKCQLDAANDFCCRSYCLLNMFRAPLCPSSGAREYYTCGCCLWYLVLWFSSWRYGVELRVMCPICGLLELHTIPTTWKPKHQIPQTATICIILSSSWWWA